LGRNPVLTGQALVPLAVTGHCHLESAILTFFRNLSDSALTLTPQPFTLWPTGAGLSRAAARGKECDMAPDEAGAARIDGAPQGPFDGAFIDHLDATETVLFALARALEAKSPYMQGHAERVALYALALADRIGLGPEDHETLRKGALLHDIGKI